VGSVGLGCGLGLGVSTSGIDVEEMAWGAVGGDVGVIPAAGGAPGEHPEIQTVAAIKPRKHTDLNEQTPPSADTRRTTGAPVGLSLCRPDPVVKMMAPLAASTDVHLADPRGDYSVRAKLHQAGWLEPPAVPGV